MSNFHILARVVLTLAAGKKIALPFIAGPRGHSWSEAFFEAYCPQTKSVVLFHQMSSRKADLTTNHTASACSWGVGEMLKAINEWIEEDRAAVLPQLQELSPGDHPRIAAIAVLDRARSGSTVQLGGVMYRIDRLDDQTILHTEQVETWALDTLISEVSAKASPQ